MTSRLRSIRWHELKHEIIKLAGLPATSVPLKRWYELASVFLRKVRIRPFTGFHTTVRIADAMHENDFDQVRFWRPGVTTVETCMDSGTKIIRSCELVESTWTHIQDLSNALTGMIESALKVNEFESLRPVGKSRPTYGLSPSGWSYTGIATRFPVQDKKRRRKDIPEAWINCQICVFGSGIPPLEGEVAKSMGPVVHVSFWQLATDMNDEDTSMGFPLAENNWDLADDRLIVWNSLKSDQRLLDVFGSPA